LATGYFASKLIAVPVYSVWSKETFGLKNLPEVISWMGVVRLPCERCHAGKTAQHQQPDVAGDDGHQADQAWRPRFATAQTDPSKILTLVNE
jgi:hypothetical protein